MASVQRLSGVPWAKTVPLDEYHSPALAAPSAWSPPRGATSVLDLSSASHPWPPRSPARPAVFPAEPISAPISAIHVPLTAVSPPHDARSALGPWAAGLAHAETSFGALHEPSAIGHVSPVLGSYVPPPVAWPPASPFDVTGAPSFQPPPVHSAGPCEATRSGGPPRMPESLTSGFPTPDSIELQKIEHARGLDEQLHKQIALLMQRHKATLEFLREKNEQQKRHTNAAIDQQMMKSELELQAKHAEQMLLLAQACKQRKFDLEQQAGQLEMEYNVRRIQEELLVQDYEVHRKYFEASSCTEVIVDAQGGVGRQHPQHGGEVVGSMAGGYRPPPVAEPVAVGGPFRSSAAPPATSEHGGDNAQAVGALPNSRLFLIIHGAYDLKNRDTGIMGDVSDPFVMAKVGKQVFKTPTIDNNLNPVWEKDNYFTFEVGQDHATLHLEVVNANKFFANNSLGKLSVDLRRIPPKEWVRRKEKLENGGNGQLEFDLRLEPL